MSTSDQRFASNTWRAELAALRSSLAGQRRPGRVARYISRFRLSARVQAFDRLIYLEGIERGVASGLLNPDRPYVTFAEIVKANIMVGAIKASTINASQLAAGSLKDTRGLYPAFIPAEASPSVTGE